MLKWILMGLMLAGCNPMGGDQTASANVNPGFYEVKESFSYNGAFTTLKGQIHLNADKSYAADQFVNDLDFLQATGKWTQSNGEIRYTEKLRRTLNDAGAWGPWSPTADTSVLIRSVTANSFQSYVDYSGLTAEQKTQLQGVESGWKTYNRLGD